VKLVSLISLDDGQLLTEAFSGVMCLCDGEPCS
jgi:hypothetical protein